MNQPNIKIILKKGKENSLKRFHPWLFSGAIQQISGNAEEGDVVDVYSYKNGFLGTGHYQGGSIAVRLVAFEPSQLDYDFWKEKLLKAYFFRQQLGLTNNKATNCYRLLFAEGDGMPGFIIDYYNGTAVFQFHSIGMYLIRTIFVDALKEIMGESLLAVYSKSEDTLPSKPGLKAMNGYLYKRNESAAVNNIVSENHNLFHIDWEGGQKTGFFIDQRDNRALLAQYSQNKMVLNTFAYSGGFSVYAAKAGATEVHSTDISKKAMELTDRNILLNNITNHQSFVADTFDYLKHKENTYDVIVLDPPAFAKNQRVKHNAIMGYKRLNYEAIRQIKPGGILFTFSCSQAVDKITFNNTVMAAAIEAGRNVRVLHHLSQPPDHCVNIFHPEGEYLKGLVVHVE